MHPTRHTFARIVAEETGSIVETQDALNHSNPSTTRVYVQRIAVKRDRHGALVMRRFAGVGARAAAGKVPVFGLLKRNGKVYTRIVEDVSRKTLRQIIRTKVVPESLIYTDSFRSYDGLVLDGFKHYRINHQECFAMSKRQHINGIENFRGYAKTKLKSYYGVSREHFRFLPERNGVPV